MRRIKVESDGKPYDLHVIDLESGDEIGDIAHLTLDVDAKERKFPLVKIEVFYPSISLIADAVVYAQCLDRLEELIRKLDQETPLSSRIYCKEALQHIGRMRVEVTK